MEERMVDADEMNADDVPGYTPCSAVSVIYCLLEEDREGGGKLKRRMRFVAPGDGQRRDGGGGGDPAAKDAEEDEEGISRSLGGPSGSSDSEDRENDSRRTEEEDDDSEGSGDDMGSLFLKFIGVQGVIALQQFHLRRTSDAELEITDPGEERDSLLWRGPAKLPQQREERTELFLKLLRHSLSELQRDRKLAAAVMLHMASRGDFENVLVLRRFLAIVLSEYVYCDRHCDEERESWDHFCADWGMFDLETALFTGISFLSEDLAACLVAFIRYTYLREFGHLLDASDEENVEHMGKQKLKRTIVANRAEEGEDDVDRSSGNVIPETLIGDVIRSLGLRCASDRNKLLAFPETGHKKDEETYGKLLDSYQNGIRALVGIGELSVQILPDNERFYGIACSLVQSLCLSTAGSLGPYWQTPHLDGSDPGIIEDGYQGKLLPHAAETRLASPLRYFNCITKATEIARSRAKRPSPESRDCLEQAVEVACNGRPPEDIRRVVRTLFLRELVDVREAGLGYGDFLVWCRFESEVTPYEPLLFWYVGVGGNFILYAVQPAHPKHVRPQAWIQLSSGRTNG
jgi:hypothetical protein